MWLPGVFMKTDPPAVSDGCAILPFVPSDKVGYVSVWRFVGRDGGKTAVALPIRLGVNDDEVTLSRLAGGGIFRVQARDHDGRFLKGYPSREVIIEGPEREVSAGVSDGEGADAAPAEDPIDIDPMMRAWLTRFDTAQTRLVDALRDAAKAETDAAKAHTQVAVSFVERVTAPQLLQQSEALRAMTQQLEAMRTELATERASHAQTRATCEAARVEAATLRALMEAGGRYVAPSKSWAEILIPSVMREIGPAGRAALAAALGLPPEAFAQLTSATEPPSNGASAG